MISPLDLTPSSYFSYWKICAFVYILLENAKFTFPMQSPHDLVPSDECAELNQLDITGFLIVAASVALVMPCLCACIVCLYVYVCVLEMFMSLIVVCVYVCVIRFLQLHNRFFNTWCNFRSIEIITTTNTEKHFNFSFFFNLTLQFSHILPFWFPLSSRTYASYSHILLPFVLVVNGREFITTLAAWKLSL